MWGAGGVGLIVFNLFTINGEYHVHDLPPAGHFPRTGVVDFLQRQDASRPEPFRISSAGLLPGGSSAGAVYGLRDITGNSPLHLAAFEEFSAKMGEWRRWQLLNVLYVLDTRDLDGEGLRRVHEEGDLKVYQVTDPFPHSWIVHDVRVVDDLDEAVTLLDADSFDLRRSAVLTDAPPFAFQVGEGSRARTVEVGSNTLRVEAELSAAGLLVISEVFYPGWQATVDGKPAPLLQADGILRGVPLTAGSHVVELRYLPPAFVWGVWISGLAVVASVLTLLWGTRDVWRRDADRASGMFGRSS